MSEALAETRAGLPTVAGPPAGTGEGSTPRTGSTPRLAYWKGVADLTTPVAAFLKLTRGQPNAFLLESIEGGSARGRYSVIGMAPDLVWRCRGGVAEVNRNACAAPHAFVADPRPALDSLRALAGETRMELPAGVPPMIGGLFGYLGYDMVRLMERLPGGSADPLWLCRKRSCCGPTLFCRVRQCDATS